MIFNFQRKADAVAFLTQAIEGAITPVSVAVVSPQLELSRDVLTTVAGRSQDAKLYNKTDRSILNTDKVFLKGFGGSLSETVSGLRPNWVVFIDKDNIDAEDVTTILSTRTY